MWKSEKTLLLPPPLINFCLALHCSTDTIIPVWAYMLLTKYLSPYASIVIFGNEKELEKKIFHLNIENLQLNYL